MAAPPARHTTARSPLATATEPADPQRGPRLAASHRMPQAPLAGRALLLARNSLRRIQRAPARRQLTWLALFGLVLGFAFGPSLLAFLH